MATKKKVAEEVKAVEEKVEQPKQTNSTTKEEFT